MLGPASTHYATVHRMGDPPVTATERVRELTQRLRTNARPGRPESASAADSNEAILKELQAIRELLEARESDKSVAQGLRAVRGELTAARTIPSVPHRLRHRAVETSIDYILSEPRLETAMVAAQKHEVLDAALRAVTVQGIAAEFGVYQGHSLTQIAQHFKDQTVHGFDSFIGLPEDWAGTSKGAGAFDVGGTPPALPVDNVEFHVGFFDKTVPVFATEHEGPFAFAHLDADLYSSTKTVMDTLFDWFVPGTVIVFDEYFGYHGWELHEHKAFMELLERSGMTYQGIGIGHMNLAVKLVAA